MLLKYFYDKKLAHASYLVGCQRTKEAVIVDPGRDITPYLQAAAAEGVSITAVAETHIHADYVSGARQLADRVGAMLYLSDEGPADWKYMYHTAYPHCLLRDRDQFMIGNLQFEVMHTPGHTPESISFLLTDLGGGANQPMGIFTGDFVFVGSVGRPDLLEEAAGVAGSAEAGARDLFRSVERFRGLPDYLQVWPAHGAGSACGKGLGAIPSSTVGYEKRFNPALQMRDEEAFVDYILADQPEAPRYFAVMKRVNKEGPAIIREDASAPLLNTDSLKTAIAEGTVIDLTPTAVFAQQHVPGTINIPISMLAAWAGWLVDYSKPVSLIIESSDNAAQQAAEAACILQKIGIDAIAGWYSRTAVMEKQRATESYPSATPAELAPRISAGDVLLIDVRSDAEWNKSHLPQAVHQFLGRLPQVLSATAAGMSHQQQDALPPLSKDRPIVVQCQGGARSAVAAGLLQAKGYSVINMEGGFNAWKASDLPVQTASSPNCESGCRVPAG